MDQQQLSLDLGAALQHVRALTGRDDAPVTIAVIRPAREGEAAATVYHRRGALVSLWSWIEQQQATGFSIYITVNETATEKRAKDDITRIRAVYTDDDTKRSAPRAWPIEPHLIVESSPGKFHYYWFVDEAPDDSFAHLQSGIAAQYGTDASATDIARVLRLAGTVNLKPDAGGHVTRIVRQSDRPRYTKAEVFAAFPPVDTITADKRPSFDLDGARNTIETGGAGLHDALRGLAGHFAARGVSGDLFGPMLTAYAEQHSDGSERYRQRIAEIPGLVKSAVAKFLQPDTLDASDPLDLFASAQARPFGFVPGDYPAVVELRGRLGAAHGLRSVDPDLDNAGRSRRPLAGSLSTSGQSL